MPLIIQNILAVLEVNNSLDNLSNKVCVPNETEDLNLHVLNMITRINE